MQTKQDMCLVHVSAKGERWKCSRFEFQRSEQNNHYNLHGDATLGDNEAVGFLMAKIINRKCEANILNRYKQLAETKTTLRTISKICTKQKVKE